MLEKYIKNHFLSNPEWETIFLKHYPNWTPESYTKNAIELFNKNGYHFVDFKKGRQASTVDLYGPKTETSDGKFLFGFMGSNDTVHEQIIIKAICEYHIDFSTFK